MKLTSSPIRIAAALLALASTVACSKKEEAAAPTPAPNPNVSASTMSWTVDGAAVTAATVTANDLPSSGGIVIVGTANNTTVQLAFTKAANTYVLSPTGASSATAFYSANGVNYAAGTDRGTGTITVASLTSSNIVGTFSLNPASSTNATKAITNGSFNIKL